MTESSPVTHINPFVGKRKVGSIGIPIPDTECRIVDLNDGETDMPVEESGELLVKGPSGHEGILEQTGCHCRNPDQTDGCIPATSQKWTRRGIFYIVDRKKDMIISGGYNVYPRDIEEVFFRTSQSPGSCGPGCPPSQSGVNRSRFSWC